jgi:hypothetical protein
MILYVVVSFLPRPTTPCATHMTSRSMLALPPAS